MRYKDRPSTSTHFTESISNTIQYFRKRPIWIIVLIAVLIWIVIALSYTWSTPTKTKTNRNHHPSISEFNDILKQKGQINPHDLANLPQFQIPFGKKVAFGGMKQQLPVANKMDNILINKENAEHSDNLSIKDKVSNAKKVLVTYGQNCCTTAKKRMCDSAFKNGEMYLPRDECHAYDATVMDEEFSNKNAHILKQGRGAGYWLWKPYIIYKWLTDDTMEDDNSYLIYSDAGAQVIGDVGHVLRFMEENDDIYNGVLFFGVGFDQQYFCKRDAFILQNCDNDKCYKAMQINAFVAFFRKSEFSRKVVKKWLDDCQDERMLTDKANTLGKPNLSGFRDHRHDQAVITNIMVANDWNYDTTNGPILDKVFSHDRYKA